ncbi:flavoprotein [Pyrenophora tritici-repentis]|nr:flavoprotein [Pyrenophora tritici-repentis]
MHIHDVLIVGGGPAGLAVAARLREHTPSATFTDDEHQRYHWIRKHGRKMSIKNYRTNKDSLPTPPSSPESSDCGCEHQTPAHEAMDMLVLDADGADWMAKWKRLFKTFHIDYLRSPMFFHVDPADRDALLGYTYENEREKDVQALPGVAGKEVSKHKKKKTIKSQGRFLGRTPDVDERDRKDYFVPRTDLFDAHCEEIIKRYRLGNDMLRQERVVNIEYEEITSFLDAENDSVFSDDASEDDRKVFRVTTDQGVRYAHLVILAVGPGNAPSIPSVPGLPSNVPPPHEGFTHAMQIKQFPPSHVTRKIKARQTSNMLIVGGGLTSVQLADLALKRGVTKVYLLMRGPLKVKHFDVDLEWVGKFRNLKQAEFWTADTDEERFEMMMKARNGGSMTPRYRKILDTQVARGNISLHTYTTLKSVDWDPDAKTWTCKVDAADVELPSIDYIVFATGIQTDVRSIPYLASLQQQYPIKYVGGLPCLNEDLMWRDDVPLFATGRLAGLRLGPGAPNLVGARVGAERIAWNVDDALRKLGRLRGSGADESEGDSADEKMDEYAAARANRFDSLVGLDGVGV